MLLTMLRKLHMKARQNKAHTSYQFLGLLFSLRLHIFKIYILTNIEDARF